MEIFGVSKSAIWSALKRLQVTYKKTLRYPKAQETQRQQHLSKIDQYVKDGKTIVTVDESRFEENYV